MIRKWKIMIPELSGAEKRRAYVYLPTMYREQPGRRFPVLYMFDGHNLFFDSDATYGKSWGLANYLDFTDTPLIVAAVECSHDPNNGRLSEYSPYDCASPAWGEFKGRGDVTMRWFTRRFKPLIDRRFRTIPDREHTFIGGSSMGGLMSLYAVTRYNHVYSRAAALSPSVWVQPEKLRRMIRSVPIAPETVVYMDYGARELENHQDMRRHLRLTEDALLDRGVYLTSRIIPGGEHSEASWERQLPFAISALMYGLNGNP